MNGVETTTLQTIMGFVKRQDEAGFTAQFPGLILLAMGTLTAEQMGARAGLLDISMTQPVQFGDHPKHDVHSSHPLSGRGFHLNLPAGTEVMLGRGHRCDIVVPDDSVSDQHCRLQVIEDGLAVRDLQSTNGTRINQVKLDGTAIGHLGCGDLLTVGRYSFQLHRAATLYAELEALALLDEG